MIYSMQCDAVCSSVNFVCFHRNSQSFLKMSGLYSFLPASEGNGSPERSRLLRLARRRQSIVTFISLWRGSSHVLMVLSYDPDATFVPSGENDTLFTSEECPSSVCRHSPLVTSHSFTVVSQDPDATFVPSGENDTLLIQEDCPSSVSINSNLDSS